MAKVRLRLNRVLSASLLALTISFFAPAVARASLLDCFNALVPAEQAIAAAEVAAQAGTCGSLATGDPIMAMTIAAMTAAAVGGEFSTIGECKAKVNGAVGHLIAEALLVLFPNEELLQKFVNGSLPGVTFTEVIAAIPGLNALPAYIQCGCNVAGAPGEFKKIAEEYYEAVQGCGSFASDAVALVLDTAGGGFEAIHEWLHGTAMKPGTQMEQQCYAPKILPDELWTATPIHAGGCYSLICEQGHFVVEKEVGGKKLNKCSATCPDPIHHKVTPGDQCYSWTEWAVVEAVPAYGSKVPMCKPNIQKVVCCADGQKVFEWGKCTPDCAPGYQGWSQQTNKCEYCPAGTKSDGRGPCISCTGAKSFVANDACHTCKPWQEVHLASVQSGGSQCQDICPNGVYNAPKAPQPISAAPLSAQAVAPGQGGPGRSGAGNMVATPSTTGLPGPGGGAPVETVVATPIVLPCIPCGVNEISQNNQCQSCGPKAVATNMAADNNAILKCMPCAGRQVAKLIGGAMICAADCSSVGGGGKGRPSTNYITNPKDTAHCIACPKRSKPNDAHTACITTISIESLPKGPVTAVPSLPSDPSDKRKKTTKAKDGPKGTAVRINCPPRMRPNPSGTGCLPDIDMPGFGGVGSSGPGGTPAGGRRGR